MAIRGSYTWRLYAKVWTRHKSALYMKLLGMQYLCQKTNKISHAKKKKWVPKYFCTPPPPPNKNLGSDPVCSPGVAVVHIDDDAITGKLLNLTPIFWHISEPVHQSDKRKKTFNLVFELFIRATQRMSFWLGIWHFKLTLSLKHHCCGHILNLTKMPITCLALAQIKMILIEMENV